jgi:hypothetical protein
VSQGLAGLLLDVQRRIEALYALEPGAPVADFLIPQRDAVCLPGAGSRTLVRQQGDEVALAVVLEEGVGEGLERDDPRVRLDERNFAPFCTAAEEVSHFVYLLFCAAKSRSVTQLELELQGEVDKYLCSVFLLSLQNEGAVASGLRARLFRGYRLCQHVPQESVERYRTANRLADRYCGFLEARFLRPARLGELARESRRFYRLGQREKLERIAALA